MKTKKFILGIVTTLVCAIAMIGVLGPVEVKPEKEVNGLFVASSAAAHIRKNFERMGAYDASLWNRR